MGTSRRELECISPKELDQYLAKGWYRMGGQGVYTCSLLWGSLGQTPVIWLRLPLRGFEFNKRQRKLMRRNAARFRVEIRPFEFYEEQEFIFAIYKEFFSGTLGNSFRQQVNGRSVESIFDSMEVAIYDEDRLVAFSLFDLGEESATSISGIYLPEYASYSLGFWTMLLEMQYAQKIGKLFYYPGYVAPGISKFDYKLRIGEVEGFLPSANSWISYRCFPHELLGANKDIKLLSLLERELVSLGFAARMVPGGKQTLDGTRGVVIDEERGRNYFGQPWLLALAHRFEGEEDFKLFLVGYSSEYRCFYLQAVATKDSDFYRWEIDQYIKLQALTDVGSEAEKKIRYRQYVHHNSLAIPALTELLQFHEKEPDLVGQTELMEAYWSEVVFGKPFPWSKYFTSSTPYLTKVFFSSEEIAAYREHLKTYSFEDFMVLVEELKIPLTFFDMDSLVSFLREEVLGR